MITFQVIFN